MTIGKTYTTKFGTKLTPICYSEIKNYIWVRCEFTNGIRIKLFWAKHHLFRD